MNLRRGQRSCTYFFQQEDNAYDMHEIADTYAAQKCVEVCLGSVVQYCSVKSVVDKSFVIPATAFDLGMEKFIQKVTKIK